MRLLFGIAVALCLFTAPLRANTESAQVPVSKADIVRFLGQMPEIAPIREEMQRLGFRDENLELAVEHAGSFYTDPKIAGYIADRVLGAYSKSPTQAEADGLIWPLIRRGLGHLPTNELRFYYSVEQAMIKAMPVRQCGLAVRDRLSPKRYSDAMSRVAARLHTPSLKEYYRIQLKAARLGVGRDAVRLGRHATEQVETRIGEELTELIAASPNSTRLMSALNNIGRTDNGRACTIGQMFYQAVMAIDGTDQRNALIYMGLP